MAYTPIANGDSGGTARGIINGIGTNLDAHTSSSGSDVHNLGTISNQSASSVNITGGSIVSGYGRFGNSEGFTYFETDGTVVFSGSATVWDDIFFPLVTAKQGQTDKPAFDSNELGYLFPSSDTSAIMYIVGQMPHSLKVGSNIDPHVHWNQNHSGSVVFKLDYKWFPIGGSVPASWNTHIMNVPVVQYTSGSTHQLSYGSTMISGSMLTSGIGVSSMILMKLYRDDNTYSGNAIAYQLDIHYEKDSVGSRTEYAK